MPASAGGPTSTGRPPDIPPEPPPPPQPPPPKETAPAQPSAETTAHPYACSLCNRTFPLQNGLTRHRGGMHNVETPVSQRKRPRADEAIPEETGFPCGKCDMIARSKTGPKSHIRARHPEDPEKDIAGTKLIPQPASLHFDFCQRVFGNLGAFACHKKFKHPPGAPTLPTLVKIEFPIRTKRQRTSSSPERGDREKAQCGVCQKFYAHMASLSIHCQKFHDGQGMPAKRIFPHSRSTDAKTRNLPALVCPTCNRQCMSKSGLTLHRISQHGYQPTRAKTSQRNDCEETALHLLTCTALRPLRLQFAVVGISLKELCFSKQLAQFLLALGRGYTPPQSTRPRTHTPAPSPPVSTPPVKTGDELDPGNPDRFGRRKRLDRSPTGNGNKRSPGRQVKNKT